jgi:hypothetical protein
MLAGLFLVHRMIKIVIEKREIANFGAVADAMRTNGFTIEAVPSFTLDAARRRRWDASQSARWP